METSATHDNNERRGIVGLIKHRKRSLTNAYIRKEEQPLEYVHGKGALI
jgi:hypothetical protein